MPVLSFLKRLFAPAPWPEGEPWIVGGGRVGTVAPDGTLIGAPGVAIAPLCSCQREFTKPAQAQGGSDV